MGGAFQVSRDIFENEIWTDVVKFRIFFYILGKAVFSHDGIQQAGIHVKRGQYLRSLRNIQDDLAYREGRGNAVKKYPLTTIQRKIKSLEKEERITTKSTEYGTLFTVINYAKYQGFDHYKNSSVEQLRNSDGTATEQRRNNNNNAREGSNNENNKDSTMDPIPFFEINFHGLSPFQSEQLVKMCEENGDELVLAAMKLALKRNGKSIGYLEGVLRKWRDNNVKNLQQAVAFENEKINNQQQRIRTYNQRDNARRDKLPKHMTGEKKREKPDLVSEEDQKELEEYLAGL